MEQRPGQYDFMMDAPTSSRRAPGGLSPKIVIAGLVGFLLLFAIVIILLISSSGKPNNTIQIVNLAKQQTELIRVAELGLKDARTTQAKDLAITTSMSVTSDFSNLKNTIRAAKLKIKVTELKSKDTKTDAALETALQNNRFDEEFMKILQAQLVSYQKNMDLTYKATQNKALKESLKKQYQNASILINIEPEE